MSETTPKPPIEDAMRAAVRAVRDQLGEVEETLHSKGEIGETGRKLLGLGPLLSQLGVVMLDWERAIKGP